jgi:hypothetical protein
MVYKIGYYNFRLLQKSEMEAGTLTEGGVSMGPGKIASIVINIWIAGLLIIILIASGILTTITAAVMPNDTEPYTTSHLLFTISSIVAWVSAGLLLFGIALALILTEGLIILYAPTLIILLAIGTAILCAVVAGLNIAGLIASFGALSYNDGWYAALGASLAAGGFILGIGFFVILLALKKPKPQSIETVVIV